jgi:phosphoribosylaminoimidazole (AIR) synthetase
MGAGMLIVVPAADAARMPSRAEGLDVYRAGSIMKGSGDVTLV